MAVAAATGKGRSVGLCVSAHVSPERSTHFGSQYSVPSAACTRSTANGVTDAPPVNIYVGEAMLH